MVVVVVVVVATDLEKDQEKVVAVKILVNQTASAGVAVGGWMAVLEMLLRQ